MPDLNPNEQDPAVLWAEIHRLRAEAEGPHGFSTWKEAAVAERIRRVAAEQQLLHARRITAETTLVISFDF